MDELKELADAILAEGVNPRAAELLRQALARGYSPLCVLRRVVCSLGFPVLNWLALEAVMLEWCRQELARIVLGTARGSAEWRRVKRWRWLLEESEMVDIDGRLDGLPADDFDIGGEG